MKIQKKSYSGFDIKFALFILLFTSIVMTTYLIVEKYKHQNIIASTEIPMKPSISSQNTNNITPMFHFPFSKKEITPITPDNVTGFSSSWTLQSSDGYIEITNTFDKENLHIINAGSLLQSSSIYRDGIPFLPNGAYTIYFSAKSTINRKIEVEISNNDTSVQIASQEFEINQENKSYQMNFTPNINTWNGRVSIHIGNDHSSDIAKEHTIEFINLRIVSSIDNTDIAINQIGYFTKGQKRCTFPYNAGDIFDVVDMKNNNVVYSGAIVNLRKDEATQEIAAYGDFTNFEQNGTYYIRSQIGTKSMPFIISDNPYIELNDALLFMLSLQRSGEALGDWAKPFDHGDSYMYPATIYGLDKTLDVSGGWYDAGDYGRYIKTGAKTTIDLLFSYLSNPDFFTDTLKGPSSGNGVPDILDEAHFELTWMLKMQDSDGGVYNKVLTQNVAEIIDSAMDHQPLFILDKETTATAAFCGTMAIASYTFQNIDSKFAKKCLNAAINANKFLKEHPETIDIANPSDINGGQYLDDDDKDGRFFANLALWSILKEKTYLQEAKKIYANDANSANGLTWDKFGGYGRYLYLIDSKNAQIDSNFYQDMKQSLENEVAIAYGTAEANSYNVSIYEYGWGSNGTIANNGILLAMYYDIFGDIRYQQTAMEQLNYLLGKNSLKKSFVSGFGTDFVKNPHSRISKIKNTLLTGALVGGPNSYREDPITQKLNPNIAPAKTYIDTFESYSTNEISIYWNSAMIYLLTKLS